MRILLSLAVFLAASTSHAAVRITAVTLSRDPKGWRVDVKASDKTPYTVHALPDPARLIIDVPDATLTVNSQVKPVATDGGPALRFSQFTRRPNAVRVVVDLIEETKVYEISASPAMNIAVLIPANGTPPAATAGGKAVVKAPDKAPAPPARPAGPPVISAREMEKTLKGAPKPAPRAAERAQTRKGRSSVTSRGGAVDRADLLGTMLSAPGALALPPVAPSWSQEEALACINSSQCPESLRRRLIEVVSDPAIQSSAYVWGEETPGQFDCSGLMLYIYGPLDVKLPRVSFRQAEYGTAVERENLRAGDLVFFNTRGKDISHVGIFLGDGRFLHAANPRENLQITALDNPYYAQRFVTARRVYSPAVAQGDAIRQGG